MALRNWRCTLLRKVPSCPCALAIRLSGFSLPAEFIGWSIDMENRNCIQKAVNIHVISQHAQNSVFIV
jgi:hypothetical protein